MLAKRRAKIILCRPSAELCVHISLRDLTRAQTYSPRAQCLFSTSETTQPNNGVIHVDNPALCLTCVFVFRKRPRPRAPCTANYIANKVVLVFRCLCVVPVLKTELMLTQAARQGRARVPTGSVALLHNVIEVGAFSRGLFTTEAVFFAIWSFVRWFVFLLLQSQETIENELVCSCSTCAAQHEAGQLQRNPKLKPGWHLSRNGYECFLSNGVLD